MESRKSASPVATSDEAYSVLDRVFPDRDYGFVITEGGEQVYFHRNAVLGGAFDALAPGSEVTFVRGSTIVPARVAWTAAGRIGLEFHYMIDEQELLVQLRKTSGPTSFERFRRPGLAEGLSDTERKLAEAWGVAVGLTVPDV